MPSRIVHVDISGSDEPAQHSFYADLFGWAVDAKGPGYALFRSPELAGALIEADGPAVVLGIGVGDLAAAVARAVELGGTVVVPPMNNGWVTKAQVTDPAGNPVNLIQT
jgi:predicted enzyme related to lactoylglutathione lyase